MIAMDKEYLTLAAKEIEAKFPDNHGFVLLVMPFNEAANSPANRLRYISNCERETAVKMLKEFLFRIGHAEDWMKHLP